MKPTDDDNRLADERREFLRRTLSGAAALTLGPAFFTACGKDGAAPTDSTGPTPANFPMGDGAAPGAAEGDSLVTLFTTMGDEYFTSHVAGTRQACAALGLTYEGFVNEGKSEIQLSQYETAAGKGTRMITVIPPDESNVPAIYQRANEYKVHTMLSAEMPPWYFPHEQGEYAVGFLTPFDYASFYDVSTRLMQKLEGKGKVLMLTGFPGGTPDRQRTAAAMKALEENPGVELLGSLPGRWNRLDGQRAMEDLMSAHPQFDGVIALNDEMAIGALIALNDAGRGDVPITGHNGTFEIMEYIKEGRVLATASTFPFWIGAYMVVMAYDAANGWKPSLPERMLVAQHVVVDRTNVDQYIEKYVKNVDSLPFDFKRMSRTLHPDDWDPQNQVYPLDAERYFSFAEKPAGARMPDDWKAAIDSGETERVRQLFANRYQRKILD